MNWLSGSAYDWVKAAHLIFVIFWIAGLLMLPRYLAYHCETTIGSPESEAWKARETRILRMILTPGLVVTWILGLTLAVGGGWFSTPHAGWLHAKLLLVVILSGLHGFLAAQVRKFGRDEGIRRGRFWRLINEVPSIGVILIVILVVVKPF